ncbi:AAA family ATPase [Hymenobacter sp. H14-R3]|uniref:AAA family ATPase n=1 Tax=Hymenobacter sp. H14-R3 TaxID=3046308 RepID=UPI0024BB3B22|nr:AAA family ATPase [Hymenobacter sp. H14-R3]MDJ0366002.1 AAA family ATPase [Hymenobacter sp. H14-R3]
MKHSLGLVVGKFWPPHRGHQLLLETAAAQVAELLVLVYANPDDTTHTAPTRAGWLRELYRGDDHAQGPRIGATRLRIIALTAADGIPPDAADDHTQREFVRQWLARHAEAIDVVFSSEHYGPGFAQHLGVAHVMVDEPRQQVPVSGTGLRAALAADAASYHLLDSRYLHPFIAAQYGAVPPTTVPRLVLLGAESSGKTTLATALAEALGTAWVPEYGRTLHEQKTVSWPTRTSSTLAAASWSWRMRPRPRPAAGSSVIPMRLLRRCIPTTIFTAASRPCRRWRGCAGRVTPVRLCACLRCLLPKTAGAGPRRYASFSTALS